MKKTLKSAYALSMVLSDEVWQLIQLWGVFSKTIIGNQFITSLDFLTINLAKAAKTTNDDRQSIFILNTQEQLTESFMWNDKARRRQLLDKQDYQAIYVQLLKLDQLINQPEKTVQKTRKTKPLPKNMKQD